jgi:hypothetical protein
VVGQLWGMLRVMMTIFRKNYFLALIENYDLMGIADITSCD